MNIFKILFCKHEFVFNRNIYGDEINRISLREIYRSKWVCLGCGKVKYKGELVK